MRRLIGTLLFTVIALLTVPALGREFRWWREDGSGQFGTSRYVGIDFTGKGDTFALQVTGESMIDDHILSGDYVLVERTQQANDGDIVVALVEGRETTLKRLYRESDGRIRLQPANSSMQPIMVNAADVQIQGHVLAVLRKYR